MRGSKTDVRKKENSAAGAKVNEGVATNPSSARSTATSAALAPSVVPSNPWDSLRAGSTVLAAYWDENNMIDGWWLATVTRADKNEFILKWRDTPEFPLGKVERKHIAILHPDFLASGK